MKANEFIKKHGWEYAKHILTDDAPLVMDLNYTDLKRLVESHELVGIHGYESSKEIVANAPSDDHFYSWTLGDSGVRDKTVNIGELRKAIADVESCLEVSSESSN
ncbi:hypothetical protein [Acinetobacter sp. UBA801]|uniref:hypothetical protein n=1 Tax=Acinetobacter sp. UBA801 TaxID=1945958 RepID=UPI0025C217C8|nr:hypothetical protein [Acinetobacter sp. UBA801]